MGYWFEDPAIKQLLPLATSDGIQGLSSLFVVPKMIIGSNVFPEAPGLAMSTLDHLNTRCHKKRAIIITDAFAKRYADVVERYLKKGEYTVTVWANAQPEAPLDSVLECADAMTAFEPDLIMPVGGGSVIDTAKGGWVIYERPDLRDLVNFNPLAPLNLRKKAIMAAVPTTAGTGSECTGAAVLHDHSVDRKIPISSKELIPDFAILNPEFTMSMPPELTVGTGLDVLAHAVDAVFAAGASDMSDAMGLTAIKQTLNYLPRAYVNGRDREARRMMLVAASTAGIAFGNCGVALTHSFGHTLGSLFNIHHGLAVGFFIPFSLQFYRETTDRHQKIAESLGIAGKTSDESLDNLVMRIRTFLKELNVPLSLKEMGIPEEKLQKEMERMVLYAREDISTIFSPRPMTAAQCEKFWNYTYHGKDINF